MLTNEALFNLVNTILSCYRNNNTVLMIEFLQLLNRILQTDARCQKFISLLTMFSHVSLDLTGFERSETSSQTPMIQGSVLMEQQKPSELITETPSCSSAFSHSLLVKGGILPFFLILLRLQQPVVTTITLTTLIRLIVLCDHTPSLWSELGVSRQNSHVILDYVASQCTPELISEDLIKDLFSKITGTQQIEENGQNCVMS